MQRNILICFRLQKCVEGLEAEAGEDSKSDEPMVRTILMAHSMG